VNGNVIRKPQQIIEDPFGTLRLLDRGSLVLDCGSGWQIHPRLSLLWLDNCLAVVNKGPGLISVPAPNAQLSALSVLQDFLSGRLKAINRGVTGKSLPAAFRQIKLLPVHRLDQYTSGVFCMACTASARRHLINQLNAHTMSREYVAFVEGRMKASRGTWRQWLDLTEDKTRQRVVTKDETRTPKSEAQEAITHYEVITEYYLAEKNIFVTKLRLRLETGRKHQIRVQAASMDLPLIGDRTYHPKYRPDSAQPACMEFGRQALHAELLRLDHPEQPGKRLSLKAGFPRDLRQLEAMLSRHQV
jgi:23S rRNA pseudouridine1911/1915/1917 synthase